MSPFLIGFLIAYMINPILRYLHHDFFKTKLHIKNTKLRKALAILFSYLLVIGLITVCLFYVIPQIIGSLKDLYSLVSTLPIKLMQSANKLVAHNPELDSPAANQLLNEAVPHIVNYLKVAISNLIPMLYTFSLSIIQWAFNILIAFMISIYMTTDRKIFKNLFKKILYAFHTKEKAEDVLVTLNECNSIFGNFIIGKSIDSLIIGLLCFCAMRILRLDYPVLISVIIGITNMIPYFGPFIGAIPGCIILLILSPHKMFIFIVLIIVLQQFDGWVLGPKILGSAMGLKPIGILFAILFFGAYFGPLGMFLGAPVFAVFVYLFERYLGNRLHTKNASDYLSEDILNASISIPSNKSKTIKRSCDTQPDD